MHGNAPKYTQAALGRFRAVLLKLLFDGPSDAGFGVCYNLNTELLAMHEFEHGVVGYNFVSDEAEEWPHAMRSDVGRLLDFFVPETLGRGIWEGDNLKMRQNLIQYLLGRVAHHEAMLRGGVALAG